MELLKILAAINSESGSNIRMIIPDEYGELITKFQKAWRSAHGRKITKEAVVWLMMDLASCKMEEAIQELELTAALKEQV